MGNFPHKDRSTESKPDHLALPQRCRTPRVTLGPEGPPQPCELHASTPTVTARIEPLKIARSASRSPRVGEPAPRCICPHVLHSIGAGRRWLPPTTLNGPAPALARLLQPSLVLLPSTHHLKTLPRTHLNPNTPFNSFHLQFIMSKQTVVVALSLAALVAGQSLSECVPTVIPSPNCLLIDTMSFARLV